MTSDYFWILKNLLINLEHIKNKYPCKMCKYRIIINTKEIYAQLNSIFQNLYHHKASLQPCPIMMKCSLIKYTQKACVSKSRILILPFLLFSFRYLLKCSTDIKATCLYSCKPQSNAVRRTYSAQQHIIG